MQPLGNVPSPTQNEQTSRRLVHNHPSPFPSPIPAIEYSVGRAPQRKTAQLAPCWTWSARSNDAGALSRLESPQMKHEKYPFRLRPTTPSTRGCEMWLHL